MYQFSYAEVLEEDPKESRERERDALSRSIQMLKIAEEKGVRSRECVEAIFHTRRLWALFIDDLGKPENDLPDELRASLISIGLWIMSETEQIRLNKSENFKGLIDVSETILEGLR